MKSENKMDLAMCSVVWGFDVAEFDNHFKRQYGTEGNDNLNKTTFVPIYLGRKSCVSCKMCSEARPSRGFMNVLEKN